MSPGVLQTLHSAGKVYLALQAQHTLEEESRPKIFRRYTTTCSIIFIYQLKSSIILNYIYQISIIIFFHNWPVFCKGQKPD